MEIGFTYYVEGRNALGNLIAKTQFKRKVFEVTKRHNIEGFTMTKAWGAWRGKTEPSYQMLLVGVPKRQVRALATDFRDSFNQEAVMLIDGRKVEFL